MMTSVATAALMIVRKFYEDLKGGSYEVRAVANEPCRGEAALKVEVSR